MPTYEYECRKCGHSFELFQSMTEERIKKCPECGGRVDRLIGTGAGILFKGSGFYQTDYRSSNYTSDAKKETSTTETKSSSSDSGAKSDTKNGAKKADKPKAAASGD